MYPRPITVISFLLLLTTLAAPSVYAAPGDLDQTFAGFGAGGEVFPPRGPAGMAIQPDGRIVLAANSGIGVDVTRYLPNGTLDPSFSGGGVGTYVNPAYVAFANSVAIQADGKIVVAGWAETSRSQFMVMRLTANGTLDVSFDVDGWVTTDFAFDADWATALVIQPDGKIIAGGITTEDNQDFAAARYLPNGALDTSFGSNGKVRFDIDGDDQCYDIALQDDGKLVMVGSMIHPLKRLDADFTVARLNSNGTLDASFDGDGVVTTGFRLDHHEDAHAVATQPDGKIVVSGIDRNTPGGKIARYNSDGSLDNSFDGDGKLSIDQNSCKDVKIQPDGRIVVVGTYDSPDGDNKFAFHRLNPNGSLDATFDGDGSLYLDFGSGEGDAGTDLALLVDGRIIACGSGTFSFLVLRLWPDGSFDAGGRQTVGFEDTFTQPGLPKDVIDDAAYGMALQSDGKIVLAGEMSNAAGTESDFALARFNPDGMLDTSFGVDGRAQLGFFAHDAARAVAIQPDGKIVVAGYMENGSVINFMVARFNPNGSEDGTFGFGGLNVMDFAGGDDYGAALALAPDGKIVVAGTVFNGAHNVFGVARFNSDGTPDNSFDLDGKQLLEFSPGLTHAVSAVVVQADGKIVVGGTVNENFALARLNVNGSLDFTFGLMGLMQTDMGGRDFLNALAVGPGGWLYAAGVRVINGDEDFALAQYKPNGTLAACPPFPCSNWPDGKAFVDFGGTSSTAYAVDVRGDGQVVAAGCANGQFAWAQLRTNTLVGGPIEGSTDFVGNVECARAVKFVAPNKLVAAGFENYNGDLNFALARFETRPDASVVDVAIDETPRTGLFEALGPNPTREATELAFALPRDAEVRVDVHDVAGRLVRLMDIGHLPAGRHQATWDARANDGQRVSAGVYLVGLQVDGRRVGAKHLAIIR